MAQDKQLHLMRWILFYIFVGLFVVIVIATLAVVFLNIGSPTESERGLLVKLFVLEVGVAVATLFYSIFRLRRNDGIDTTTSVAKANRLDREGFKHLLDLHFHSVLNNILELFNELQIQHQANPADIDRELAVMNVRRSINEARDKLSVFSVNGIDDLTGFLQSNFPQDQLNDVVNKTLDVAFVVDDPREQRKRVMQLMRSIQAELLERVQAKLAQPNRAASV